MTWFSDWWNNLQLVEQVLYCIAVPASLILIIQTVMMLLGLGEGGEGINPSDTSGLDLPDVDFDVSVDTDVSLDGADLSNHDISNPSDISAWAALILAAVLGFLAMLLVAKIIQWSSKLAQNGTFNMKNLLGESGTVYIPIPPKGTGMGKISISCGERFLEFDAMSEGEETLSTGAAVRVVDIVSGSTLVVEKM